MRTFYLLSVISFCVAMLFSSCRVDQCKMVHCQNGGVCVKGTCECPDGFLGPHCEIEDKCYEKNCENGGTCIDGTCHCDLGYYGEFCEQTATQRYEGAYTTTETCPSGTSSYTTIISATGPVAWQHITLSPISGLTIEAEVNGNSIAVRTPQTSGNYDVSGAGILKDDQSTIELSVTYELFGSPGTVHNCTYILEKN